MVRADFLSRRTDSERLLSSATQSGTPLMTAPITGQLVYLYEGHNALGLVIGQNETGKLVVQVSGQDDFAIADPVDVVRM